MNFSLKVQICYWTFSKYFGFRTARKEIIFLKHKAQVRIFAQNVSKATMEFMYEKCHKCLVLNSFSAELFLFDKPVETITTKNI